MVKNKSFFIALILLFCTVTPALADTRGMPPQVTAPVVTPMPERATPPIASNPTTAIFPANPTPVSLPNGTIGIANNIPPLPKGRPIAASFLIAGDSFAEYYGFPQIIIADDNGVLINQASSDPNRAAIAGSALSHNSANGGLVTQFPLRIAPFSEDVLDIEIGVNDFYAMMAFPDYFNKETWQEDMNTLMQEIHSLPHAPKRVLIEGLPYITGMGRPINATWMNSIADGRSQIDAITKSTVAAAGYTYVSLDNMTSDMIRTDDNIHPNPLGSLTIADDIEDSLR